MLIEFSVENYLSFKDRATLSMRAADLGELHPEHVLALAADLRLLKSAVLYGANASGKTNLVRAMAFMRDWVISSSKDTQAGERIPVRPFRLSTETEGKPSRFEVVFLLGGVMYRYGFVLDGERVHEEWLYEARDGEEEVPLYVRHGAELDLRDRFPEGTDLATKTRDNALFLSVVSQFNGSIAVRVVEWFDALEIIGESQAHGQTELVEWLSDPVRKQDILMLARQADLGIANIAVVDLSGAMGHLGALLLSPPPPAIVTARTRYDGEHRPVRQVSFEFDRDESAGTRKFLALAAPVLRTLRDGGVLVVDEMDARFHVLLVRAILDLFHAPANDRAQLVFASHGTSILSRRFFRPDQIWFTEKDRYGATDLYSLVEYELPPDASFERDYIQGKYGAIPFIGDIAGLVLGRSHE